MWQSFGAGKSLCLFMALIRSSSFCHCCVFVCVCVWWQPGWIHAWLGISQSHSADRWQRLPPPRRNQHTPGKDAVEELPRRPPTLSIQQWVIVHGSSSKTWPCLRVNLGASMFWWITSSQQVACCFFLVAHHRSPKVSKLLTFSSTVHVRKTCHGRWHIITATHGKSPGVYPERSYVPDQHLRG